MSVATSSDARSSTGEGTGPARLSIMVYGLDLDAYRVWPGRPRTPTSTWCGWPTT